MIVPSCAFARDFQEHPFEGVALIRRQSHNAAEWVSIGKLMEHRRKVRIRREMEHPEAGGLAFAIPGSMVLTGMMKKQAVRLCMNLASGQANLASTVCNQRQFCKWMTMPRA